MGVLAMRITRYLTSEDLRKAGIIAKTESLSGASISSNKSGKPILVLNTDAVSNETAKVKVKKKP